MPKSIKLKTKENSASVSQYLNGIADASVRKDCKVLLAVFKKATGVKPKMWGESIVGFGSYVYYRSNGDEGQFMATGFSARKAGPTIYILPGYTEHKKLLSKIGPYKKGNSCITFKNLDEVDLEIVDTLIKAGIKDLQKTHTVTM